ncbi:MAG: hypothetical protein JWL75_188 [Parcubacteria group bacterium]|nr:hypothetical protein [Parcubacteria group bacterium]
MADTGKVTYRIPTTLAWFMGGICVIADGLQLILDLTGALAPGTFLVTIFDEGIISAIFLWRGVTYTSGKKALPKLLTLFGMNVIELIPILNALPTLTIGVVLIIRSSRAEDRLASNAKQQVGPSQSGRSNWTKMESYNTGAVESAEDEYENA